DNSFGQGTKDDDPAVSVVSGSIPPNKSDLTRFYQASETVSGQTFLYLAWERTNVLGSANMDFEINQQATTNLATPGQHTINLQPGELPPNSPPFSGLATCAAGTFGETAINLTGAGVFGTSGCQTFASTFLSSRSSASFTAEKKDFVAPVPTNISNCGRVTIIKNTDPRGV